MPLLRIITLLLSALTLVVVVPLVALSAYNHPSPTDDYCFANTVLHYGFWQAQRFYYDGWTGRFFHNFIVHANPLVIDWYAGYKIYPVVLLTLLLISCFTLAKQWLGRLFATETKLAVGLGLFLGFVTTLASLPEYLYWYTGLASYGLSSVLFLFLLATLIAHQRRGFGLQPGYLLIESLLIAAIIGSSEMTMVMVLSVLGLVGFGELIQRRRLSVATILLFGVAVIACYFLLTAPGNAIRMGSNPNSSNVPLTLLSSVRYMTGYIVRQLIFTPLLPLSLLYLPIAWRLTEAANRPPYLRVHSLLGGIYGIVTVLALISLHFYGVGVPPIARLINLVNLTLWLSWFYNLTLWVALLRPRVQPDRWKSYVRPVALGAAIWTLVVAASGPVVPMIYGDWLSGRAAQYDREMNGRYAQLASSADSAGLVAPLSHYPASLYLEDIQHDPKHLWNRCWADYFHKKTIILTDRPSQLAP